MKNRDKKIVFLLVFAGVIILLVLGMPQMIRRYNEDRSKLKKFSDIQVEVNLYNNYDPCELFERADNFCFTSEGEYYGSLISVQRTISKDGDEIHYIFCSYLYTNDELADRNKDVLPDQKIDSSLPIRNCKDTCSHVRVYYIDKARVFTRLDSYSDGEVVGAAEKYGHLLYEE